MRELIHIAINDLRVTFAERGVWVNILVMPVALIFIIGLVQGGNETQSGQVRIDIINHDESPLATEFLNILRDLNPVFYLCPLDNTDDDICLLGDDPIIDEARAIQRIEDGESRRMLIIPEDFEARVLASEAVDIAYRSNEDMTQPSLTLQAVQTAAGEISGAALAARVAVDVYESDFDFRDDAARAAFYRDVYDRAAAMRAALPESVTYRESGSDNGGVSDGGGFRQSVPGMGSMYVMFTVLAGAVILIQERRNWTLQRLVSMPLTRAQLLGGKVLARFLMGMAQFAIAFIAGYFLGLRFTGSLLGILVLMVSFTVCITALAMLLATLIETEQQAASAMTFLALTLAPLGGAWWPLEIVPEFMRTIGHISPVAWVMNGFTQIIYYGGGLADVWVSVVVLLGAAAVLFTVAITRFRYE